MAASASLVRAEESIEDVTELFACMPAAPEQTSGFLLMRATVRVVLGFELSRACMRAARLTRWEHDGT